MIRVLLVVLLACNPAFSQAVSPQLFSGLKWRLIGPFRGGRTVAVSGVAGDSTTFYFGAVDGGVWKTTDAGTVWAPMFDGQPVASIGAIAVAPSESNIIYAGTGETDIRSDMASGDGVYKSADGGKTWRNIGLKDTRQISRVVVDPRDPNVVFVGALGHAYGPNAERGVYKSTDGGQSWEHVLDRGPEVGVSDLAIASANPQILVAGTWNARRPPWTVYGPIGGPGSGINRSTDGGESWVQLTGNGLPDGQWGRVGVAVSADGKRIYALIEARVSGLYRSDDGGDHWILANGDDRLTTRAWYFNSVTIDPSDPDVVYVPNIALYCLKDGGKTLSIVRGAPGGDDYHQVWIDPKDTSRLIVGSDQGATISLDGGKTWTAWNNQPTGQFYHAITNDAFPYMVYGAQQDTGSSGTPNRTDHFQITGRDWVTTVGAEGGYFAPDPHDPKILYDSDAYGSVERYDMRTSLSQNIAPWPIVPLASSPSSTPWSLLAGGSIADRKYRAPWTPMLIFSPTDKKTLYVGMQYVMTTIDGGLHWRRISPDLTGAAATQQKATTPASVENAIERGYGVVFAIAPSPLRQEEVWAGSDTGRIHLTQDGGKTWQDVTPAGLEPWSKTAMIEASHFAAAEAFAAIDRHARDDQQPLLFRTRDFGKTWQKIDSGIAPGAFLRAIREDPKKRGLLFAGTERGVYVSFDDGDHWQPLQLNLPVSSARDLQIHGDDLVVATHGRALWVMDDMEPLREMHPGISCAVACFFAPAAAIRVDNNSFAGTPLPPEEPAASNPPDGGILDYALPGQADEVEITIFDQQHEVVRRFASTDKETARHPPLPIAERWFPEPQRIENTPGMHRYVWDLCWRNSGDSAVDEDQQNTIAPHGPRVPPGRYEVRLTVDGKSFTHPLVVSMDPRSLASSALLKEQYRLGKEVFEETIRSRGSLAEINSVQAYLADLKLQGHDALAAQVVDFQAVLRELLEGDGLEIANAGLDAVLNAVEGGDREVPAQVMELYRESRRQAEKGVAEWASVKKTRLAALNTALQQAGLSAVAMSEIEEQVEALKTR